MPVPENPFTPTFGEMPLVYAGRDQIVSDLLLAFEREGRSPDLTTLISGARGTGKTALLALAAEEAQERGWIAVRVTALPGMLDEILDQVRLKSAHLIESKDGVRVSGLGIGSVLSLEWESSAKPVHTWSTEMGLLLDSLGERSIGLLILVDEVSSSLEEMVRLVATYQQFVGEGRRVGLIMAGIPYQISSMLGNQSASFLRRAQLQRLGRISDHEVMDAIECTVESSGRLIGDEALLTAAGGCEGFPFMLQLVGYRMWNVDPTSTEVTAEHARKGVARARAEMSDRVLEATWRELSDGDVAFLMAMLPDGEESRVADIADRLGKSASYVSTYRRRLLEQGVIGERRRGTVGFELPAMREFLEGKAEM